MIRIGLRILQVTAGVVLRNDCQAATPSGSFAPVMKATASDIE